MTTETQQYKPQVGDIAACAHPQDPFDGNGTKIPGSEIEVEVDDE